MQAQGTWVERLRGRRVGVVLSAGFFGFFGHAGFLQALEDAGISPCCWGGTSAGALVGAMAAAGQRPRQVLERLAALRKADFWDPDPVGALAGGLRGHGATGLLRGARLRRLLEHDLPARFEDLTAPLLVVAAHLGQNRAQAFTSGPLAPAIHASCAYPGLFRAAEVEGELFWDGGLLDKAPVRSLHRAFAPEVILVHYLPSRSGGPVTGWGAYPRAIAGAMAALRREHFEQQVELVRGAGVEVVVVASELPALGPGRLEQGLEVAEEARRRAAQELARSFTDRS